MTRFAVVIDKPAGAETAIKAHGTALMINTALRATGGGVVGKKWILLSQPNEETEAAAPRSAGGGEVGVQWSTARTR